MQESTAEEGTCFIPVWMMKLLGLEDGDEVEVRNVYLRKGTYVKF